MRYNILLMSGKGERFKNEGFLTPKALLPIGKETMFEQAMKNFPACDKWFFTVTPEINENKIFLDFLDQFEENYEIILIEKTTNGQATSAFYVTQNLEPNSEIFIGSCDAIIEEKLDFNDFSECEFSTITTIPTNLQLENPTKYGWVVKSEKKYHILCKQKLEENQKPEGVLLGFFYFKESSIFNFGYNFIETNNLFVNDELYIDTLTQVLNDKQFIFLNKLVTASVLGTPSEYEIYNK